jgi:uncharacterized membrane protein YhaH (DUF805 family)
LNWYFAALKKYVNFNGRARRKEFWIFILFNLIFFVGALFLTNLSKIPSGRVGEDLIPNLAIICLILTFIGIIPVISVTVRRLHDIGKSGWMFFISFIPLIGGIWILILMLRDSDPDENKYGHNPKIL